MTEAREHTRSRPTKAWRLLAALAAVGVLAAACASDADDGAVAEPVPNTSQPTSTTSAVGDESDTTGTETDRDSSSARSEDADGGAAEDTSVVGGSADDASAADGPDGQAAAEAGDSMSASTVEAAALRQFDDCAAVLGYFQEHAVQTVGPWGLDDGGFGGELLESAAMAADDSALDGPDLLQPGVDYSTSNVQEAGIDEPDVMKTDGRRMVVASENQVHIVDVTGPEPALIASVPLEDQWISNLLLHGDRVFVFTARWDAIAVFDEGDEAVPIQPRPAPIQGPVTEVVEIDLRGPVPAVAQRLRLEGNYINARMIDGVVRVVTSSRPGAIGWAVPESPDLAAQERSADANREIAAETTIDDWLPRFVLSDATGAAVDSGRLVDCARVWVPPHYDGPGTLSITAIDIASDGLAGPMNTTSITSDGSTVYASSEHLYVTTTRWHDWRSEPTAPDDDTTVETEIHVFGTAGRATSTYLGSTTVTGTVLNQYSMSEHAGHLRIATTTTPAWWAWRDDGGAESESLVTVFAVGDDGLAEVGRVGGLGIGERIHAVRYLGDIAAVVTFRQVDPLYLLDLSDPTAPAVRGELKITGYSAYLHPLGDDLLLGVGQEATDEGFTTGSQVSLFDIADLDRPQRIAQWTAPGGHSQVEFNALAFLHWPPSDLAVLPLNQYPIDDSGGEPPFLGAVALGTAQRDIAERARFSHADPPQRRCRESRELVVQPDGSEEPGPWERYCWYNTDWQAQVTASAVVGDRLYLASNKALESISLESLERVSLLRWER